MSSSPKYLESQRAKPVLPGVEVMTAWPLGPAPGLCNRPEPSPPVDSRGAKLTYSKELAEAPQAWVWGLRARVPGSAVAAVGHDEKDRCRDRDDADDEEVQRAERVS